MGAIKQWFQAFNPEEKKKFFMNFGLLSGGLVGFYYSLVGSKEFGSAATINCVWIFIYFTIAILILRKQKDPDFWKNYLIGAAIYCGCALVGVLIGMLSVIALAIYLAVGFAFGFMLPNFFGNTTPRNTNPGFKHNCCYTCSRYAYGQCLENPGQAISDPGSTKCGKYMQA